MRASVRPRRGGGGGGGGGLFGNDDDGNDIDVGGGSGGGRGGGLFDDIDDGGAGGAGDRCAGITAGVMALTLEMRFSVGTVGCSICGCCGDVGGQKKAYAVSERIFFQILIPILIPT